MLIDSFYIEGYKSIKEVDAQNLNTINVFMGPNNVGKSNIFSLFKDLNNFYINDYKMISFEQDSRFNKSNGIITFRVLFDSKTNFLVTSDYGYKVSLPKGKVFEEFWKEHFLFIDINPSSLEADQLIILLNKDKIFSDNISSWLSEVLDEELILDIKKDSSEKTGYRIEVDFKQSYNDSSIPFKINELGSGVSLVIAIVMIIYIKQKETAFVNFFIEEPERYLHSKTLIRLINLLTKEPFNNNRYFINTHSNALIDVSIDYKSLYKVYFDDYRRTTIQNVNNTVDEFSLLDSLGVKPSQLFQTNYLLWVEGPSDRIYLNKWIYQKSNILIEGIHYTIMYYGGKLLSHLTTSAVSDLINISKIGGYNGIIIDSDQESMAKKISKTKERIVEEFRESIGFEWVTKCREIENYIPKDIIFSAIRKVHGDEVEVAEYGQYKKITKFKKGEVEYVIDKVAVAKVACENKLDIKIYNLENKITELIKCIKSANHIH